ncbi:MAG: HEAT repeat domain-containing protein [Nostocales cyanobacterium 94392]|nr:HEAT repeat domain-containing protein [Nostocales cyanobacterium 94392]
MANHSLEPNLSQLRQEAASEKTSPLRLEELAKIDIELTRIVAKNANTAPDLLLDLGTNSDKIIRENVAGNPNAPTEILFKLGAEFPQQLLENPVFSLLLLENANFILEIPLITLQALLKLDLISPQFLELATSHHDVEVLLAIAMNPKTPQTALLSLTQVENTEVAEAARLHVTLAGEMPQGWEEAALMAMQNTNLPRERQSSIYLWSIGAVPEYLLKTLDAEVRLYIAENFNTNEQILTKLATDSYSKVRAMVAQNPHTPINIVEQLMGDISDTVREAVAYHPRTPLSLHQQFQIQLELTENPVISQEILRQLSTSQWMRIRLAIAAHSNTPEDVLLQLAKDEDVMVRKAVALNLNSTVETLEQLVTDDDRWISKIVAVHPNNPAQIPPSQQKNTIYDYINTARAQGIPVMPVYTVYDPHLLTVMADSTNYDTRQRVAQNPNTPIRVLEKLVEEENNSILETALTNLSRNSKTPDSTLQCLAQTSDLKICAAVARHRHASSITLTELAKHHRWEVRTIVAKNLKTPPKTLVQLIQDKHKTVREAAIHNPYAPKSVLEQLKILKNPNLSPDILNQLSNSQWVIIRQEVARHPKTDKHLLKQLAEDNISIVRLGVAENPNTPSSLLELLAVDKDDAVAIAVASHPNTSLNILEQLAILGKSDNQIKQAAIKALINRCPQRISQVLADCVTSTTPTFTRLLVFLHPSTPKEILAENIHSSFWLERYAIAKNSNTPPEIRAALTHDSNTIVRAAAKS